MTASIESRAKQASEFLEELSAKQPTLVVSIRPSGGIVGKMIHATDEASLGAFLTKSGSANFYYTANSLSADFNGHKASKEDVEWINAVWADVDPAGDASTATSERDDILNRLRDAALPPSAIVDSGRGYQALWLFNSPLPAGQYLGRAEQVGQDIAQILGGDPVQSADHLLRLPGTRNYPNKNKRKKGWTDSEATVVENGGARYSLEQLEQAFKLEQEPEGTNSHNQTAKHSLAEIAARLECLDPDCERDTWLKLAMAIHHELNGQDIGLVLWKELSKRGQKFVEGEPEQIWKSLGKRNHSDPVTIGTLIHLSNLAGYQSSGQNVSFDTDVANMERLAQVSECSLRYSDQAGWLYFNNHRWLESKHKPVQMAVETFKRIPYEQVSNVSQDRKMRWAKQSLQKARIESALVLTKSAPGMQRDISEFDMDPDVLLVENGLLDLPTNKLTPSRFDHWCMNLAGTRFDESATCPKWLNFLAVIFEGNPNLIHYIQRAVGYSLTGHVTEQKFFVLYGTGANGKSVFTETIQALLGDYAATTPTNTLMRDRGTIPNDIARLVGKRFVAANETNESSRFDEAFLKDLTGGDRISARFLHKEFFEFAPQFKLWIRGNHKPKVSGIDEGMWRRLQLLPFNYRIPGDERDPNLTTALREELPGILNWALEGHAEWRRRGLNPPDEVLLAAKRYREEVDLLGQFINDRCECGPEFIAKSEELCNAYNHWQHQNGNESVGSHTFSNQMELKGFRKKRSNKGMLWLGVRIDNHRDEFEEMPTDF